ncbi:SRPBCC family protein [Actinospongicola halichondriae]|uniref:SRPBCC family protein n=1 Tax=Actinospongicola halichondriae TaxID=3236844 RepID=UPI003D56F0CB
MTGQGPSKDVVIERSFDASIERVWALWTDPVHFAQWYGPTGASIPVAEMDVREGGSRLICMEMQTPGGLMQMWFTGEYLEVAPHGRLVYTEAMCREDGTVLTAAEAGMAEGHPTTTRVTVELVDDGGKTHMTMTHAGVPADSPGAAGWTMAIDKLATLLTAGDG